MPKRARQAHIPKQQTSRRKPRRFLAPGMLEDEAVYADEPVLATEMKPAEPQPAVAPARTRRRLEVLQASRDGGVAQRSIPGGLPTFERAYLVTELKTIGVISTSLLAMILVLAVLLR